MANGGAIETKGWIENGVRKISFDIGPNVNSDTVNRILDAIYSWNQRSGTTRVQFVSPAPEWQQGPDFTFVNGTGQVNSCGGYQASTDRILIHPVLQQNSDPNDPQQYAGQVTRVLSHEVAHVLGVDHQSSDSSRITWGPAGFPSCSSSLLASFQPLDVTQDDAGTALDCISQKTGTNQIPDIGDLDFDNVAEECYDIYWVRTVYVWSTYHNSYQVHSQTSTRIEEHWCGDPEDYPWFQ